MSGQRGEYISGLDPLPGGEVPRPAENPDNPIRNKPKMPPGDLLVSAREVAEWLDDQCGSARAFAFLRRFAGPQRMPGAAMSSAESAYRAHEGAATIRDVAVYLSELAHVLNEADAATVLAARTMLVEHFIPEAAEPRREGPS